MGDGHAVPAVAGEDLVPPTPVRVTIVGLETSPCPRVGAFHANDGLFFERLEDGSVRLSCWSSPNGSERVGLWDIPPDTWASVVASVSAEGETAATWSEAVELHGHR